MSLYIQNPTSDSQAKPRQEALAEFEASHLKLGLGNFKSTRVYRVSWACRGPADVHGLILHAQSQEDQGEALDSAAGAYSWRRKEKAKSPCLNAGAECLEHSAPKCRCSRKMEVDHGDTTIH